MKIALYNLTTTVLTGGIETFNWEVGRELDRRGHKVHLYGGKSSLTPKYPLSVFTYHFRGRDRFPGFGTRLKKMAERWSMALNCMEDIRKRNYDYIIIHKPYDLPWILRAAKRSGSRVAFCSGGTEFFPGYGKLVAKLDVFTACSGFNADQIKNYCGIRPKVLYNGVDVDTFRPLLSDEVLRKKILPSSDSRMIFSAARLKRFKGFQHVIEAVATLKTEFPNLYYLIAGEGPYRAQLDERVRRYRLEDRVKFLGNVPHHELPNYYSLAEVAVFPSLHLETFGISIAEAMSCGIPVIGSDSGGIPEVIGDAGILSNPESSGHLTECLRKILSDEKKREQYGIRGRKRILRKFTWKHTVDKLEEYLR